MKKKALFTILSIFLVFTLSACSNNKSNDNSSSSSSTSASSSSKKASSSSKKVASSTKSAKGNSKNFAIMIKAAQSQVPALLEQLNANGEVIKDISIEEGENSTIVYTYTLAQPSDAPVDPAALKDVLAQELAPVIQKAKAIEPDVKITVNYNNPDGSNLANITITQDDIAQQADQN